MGCDCMFLAKMIHDISGKKRIYPTQMNQLDNDISINTS